MITKAECLMLMYCDFYNREIYNEFHDECRRKLFDINEQDELKKCDCILNVLDELMIKYKNNSEKYDSLYDYKLGVESYFGDYTNVEAEKIFL